MRVVDLPHYDRINAELPDTDIFVGLVLRPEQLRQAARLKWVHTTSAGVGQLMYPEFHSSGIILTNASGVHAPAMAEHITGMIVAMARDFPGAMRFQAQKKWAQQEIWDGPARPRELSGAVAVICCVTSSLLTRPRTAGCCTLRRRSRSDGVSRTPNPAATNASTMNTGAGNRIRS